MSGECDNELKNYTLFQMIEIAKKSDYGAVWYSEKGPIQITKEGKLEPLLHLSLDDDPILNPSWEVKLKNI
jgi:hypothetical protein